MAAKQWLVAENTFAEKPDNNKRHWFLRPKEQRKVQDRTLLILRKTFWWYQEKPFENENHKNKSWTEKLVEKAQIS